MDHEYSRDQRRDCAEPALYDPEYERVLFLSHGSQCRRGELAAARSRRPSVLELPRRGNERSRDRGECKSVHAHYCDASWPGWSRKGDVQSECRIRVRQGGASGIERVDPTQSASFRATPEGSAARSNSRPSTWMYRLPRTTYPT